MQYRVHHAIPGTDVGHICRVRCLLHLLVGGHLIRPCRARGDTDHARWAQGCHPGGGRVVGVRGRASRPARGGRGDGPRGALKLAVAAGQAIVGIQRGVDRCARGFGCLRIADGLAVREAGHGLVVLALAPGGGVGAAGRGAGVGAAAAAAVVSRRAAVRGTVSSGRRHFGGFGRFWGLGWVCHRWRRNEAGGGRELSKGAGGQDRQRQG